MIFKKIAIHSAPRSGSTWLGSIFDSDPSVLYKFQPLFSYRFKGFLTPQSSKSEIDQFFNELIEVEDDFIDQKEGKSTGIVPSFKKESPNTIVYKEVRYHHILENLLKKDKTIKVIGLIRNPLSVISSWLKAPKEFREEQGWKIDEEWRFADKKNLNKPEEFNGYEKWKEVTQMFEHLERMYPEQFYLINYDNLLSDKVSVIRDVFAFCGLELSEQTFDFLGQSSSLNQDNAYSVFKIKNADDGWRRHLPAFIKEEVVNDPDFVLLNKKYQWI